MGTDPTPKRKSSAMHLLEKLAREHGSGAPEFERTAAGLNAEWDLIEMRIGLKGEPDGE